MDDLISRQDVFDMIDAVFREECEKRNTTYEEADEMTQWYLCGMMKVMEKVFDIPSASRWIPVSERLPEGGHNIIFCDSKGNVCEGVYHATLGQWVGFRWNSIYHHDDVIAWMPLPDPYKEEE